MASTGKRAPAPDWERWQEDLKKRPKLVKLGPGEWAKRFEGAAPRTEEDVPFEFPVKVPMQPSPER